MLEWLPLGAWPPVGTWLWMAWERLPDIIDRGERAAPILGTLVSLILMWRRAGKKQVNGIAAKVKAQALEIDELRRKHQHCEEARASLLEQNMRLLQEGLHRFPPPGVDP